MSDVRYVKKMLILLQLDAISEGLNENKTGQDKKKKKLYSKRKSVIEL